MKYTLILLQQLMKIFQNKNHLYLKKEEEKQRKLNQEKTIQINVMNFV